MLELAEKWVYNQRNYHKTYAYRVLLYLFQLGPEQKYGECQVRKHERRQTDVLRIRYGVRNGLHERKHPCESHPV